MCSRLLLFLVILGFGILFSSIAISMVPSTVVRPPTSRDIAIVDAYLLLMRMIVSDQLEQLLVVFHG